MKKAYVLSTAINMVFLMSDKTAEEIDDDHIYGLIKEELDSRYKFDFNMKELTQDNIPPEFDENCLIEEYELDFGWTHETSIADYFDEKNKTGKIAAALKAKGYDLDENFAQDLDDAIQELELRLEEEDS